MGMTVGFSVLLSGDQLSKVAGPGAAGRVRSDDAYDPTSLDASPTADAAVRDAIDAQWPGDSFPVFVWASRVTGSGGDGRVAYDTLISMRVSNSSDRSDAVLDAKRSTMVAALADRLGLADLDTASYSG